LRLRRRSVLVCPGDQASSLEMFQMKRLATLVVLSAVLVGTALGVFAGCGEDRGLPIPNNVPEVVLTAFPPDSGTAGYNIEFYWEGWDSDGEVDHFIYAIDPPDMYGTEDSVWTTIDSNSSSFMFEAAEYDTLYHWRKSQIARSWHVFVIKAVDDRGGVSEPDYVAFNATTVAPRTQFTSPPPVAGIETYMGVAQDVGLRVTFRWEGDDVDGLFNEVPVGYLVKVTDVGNARQAELATRVWEDTTDWIERGPNDRYVVVELDDGHNYAIAVRAIDEAGAVEPLLLVSGNLFWVGARRSSSFPELTLSSTALGRRTWQGWVTDTETYEVPLGSRYEFDILGNADWYGGLVTAFSYGWDMLELDSNETDPEGMGAWTPWSASRTKIIADFDEERDYFLHIRCKDDAGSMTLATIKFNVIELEPTKNLCYIDDWRKYPRTGLGGEELDDEVWQSMLEGYNYGEDWEDISWDEWDAPYSEHMPSLQFLSQFRVVVWSLNDNRSTALNQQSAWFYMNSVTHLNVLATYMTKGVRGGEKGKVWAFGRGLLESSVLFDLGLFCAYPYFVDADMSINPDCGIRNQTFATEFMHLKGEFEPSNVASGGAQVNYFHSYSDRMTHVFLDTEGPAIPEHLYTRPPAAELYPNLPPRLSRHGDWWSRGYGGNYFEVLEYPAPDQERQNMFYDPISEQMTGLIPLFRVSAVSAESDAHNKYCGFRYLPPDPEDPGEIVYFFFPMFPFNDSHSRATTKVVLSDWFGLPDPDVPGAGIDGEGLGALREASR
jgi:hypothetical protein